MKKRVVGWFAGFIKLRSGFLTLQCMLFILLNIKDIDLNIPLRERTVFQSQKTVSLYIGKFNGSRSVFKNCSNMCA